MTNDAFARHCSALLLLGCAEIAGFEDFTADCKTGPCGGAKGAGGSRASGGNNGRPVVGGAGGQSALAPALSSSGGAANSGGAAPVPTCSEAVDAGAAGPKMVPVMRENGACFWIDSTEVTFADYAAFLDIHPTERHDARCVRAPPDAETIETCLREVPGIVADGGVNPNFPRVCVDWCQAQAYCVWAGKELCNDRDSANPVDLRGSSAFYDACTAGTGDDRFGCDGDGCVRDCNAGDHYRQPIPVGSSTTCSRRSANGTSIYDLSGNVAEWTAACTAPGIQSVSCVVRGGSWDSSSSELECSAEAKVSQTTLLPSIGFRCCRERSD